MTSSLPVTYSRPDSLTLGDCLLHADHHRMETECWNALVSYFFENSSHGMTHARILDKYKMEYERKVLDNFVREGFAHE